MRRAPVTFQYQGNGEVFVFRAFQDVLGFGLSEGQLAELNAITPRGEHDIAALLVDEAELKRLGRWGGEAEPMRRRRI